MNYIPSLVFVPLSLSLTMNESNQAISGTRVTHFVVGLCGLLWFASIATIKGGEERDVESIYVPIQVTSALFCSLVGTPKFPIRK